mgnify:CR=1 FL=1
MAQQNQKITRKKHVDRDNTKKLDKNINKPVNKVPKRNKIIDEKITDENIITKLNQKVKVLKDISTIDGTLHKNEIVTVESFTGIGVKVIDNVGRFWFVSDTDLTAKL